MDAKELIPMIEDRVLLGAADGAIRMTILRSLALAAAVEGSGEEIVRELREFASVRRVEWSSTNHGADMADKASAALVAMKAAKEKAEAEREALLAGIDQLRFSAINEDWHTFDQVFAEMKEKTP